MRTKCPWCKQIVDVELMHDPPIETRYSLVKHKLDQKEFLLCDGSFQEVAIIVESIKI
jgi:hypothetical protein